MRRLMLVLLIAAAGCSRGNQPAGEPEGQPPEPSNLESGGAVPGGAEVIGGDEASLREFVGRALHYNIPGETQSTTVLIGALPEQLPVELPIPDGARVIGSTVRGPQAGGTEVILDVDMAPEAVLEFYQEQLGQAGWERAPEFGGGGFVSPSWPSASFCLNQDEAVIYLTATEVAGAPTDVRVSIQAPVEYSACDPQAYGPMDEASGMIPDLVSPAGLVVQSGSSSSGEGMADTTASLTTELSPAELSDSYAEQLQEAGWALAFRQSADEMVWSTWSKDDEEGRPWAGMLMVSSNPVVKDRLFAWFRVERAE